MAISRVDTVGFTRMAQSLANMSGAPLEKIIDFEAAKVLERCITLTPALNVSKARSQFGSAQYSAQPSWLYQPKTGRANVKLTKRGYVIYYLGNLYPDPLWRAIAERRKDSLQKKLKARGVSKATWLQIGIALGLSVTAPGYVRSAVPGKGRRQDGYGRRQRNRDQYYVELENRGQVVSNNLGGARILQAAINGRMNYFRKNLEHGVFKSVSAIAGKYPGVIVKQAA